MHMCTVHCTRTKPTRMWLCSLMLCVLVSIIHILYMHTSILIYNPDDLILSHIHPVSQHSVSQYDTSAPNNPANVEMTMDATVYMSQHFNTHAVIVCRTHAVTVLQKQNILDTYGHEGNCSTCNH